MRINAFFGPRLNFWGVLWAKGSRVLVITSSIPFIHSLRSSYKKQEEEKLNLQRNNAIVHSDIDRVHTPQAVGVGIRAVGVEQHHLAVGRGRRASGALEAVVARGQQLAAAGPGPLDVGGRRVLDVVVGIRKAVAAVREVVVAAKVADDDGGLDQGAVLVSAVEDLHGAADGRDPVVDVHFLQHDGRGVDGRDAVTTVAAVANAIPVSVCVRRVNSFGLYSFFTTTSTYHGLMSVRVGMVDTYCL